MPKQNKSFPSYPPKPGDILPGGKYRYKLLKEIGRGGTSLAYDAQRMGDKTRERFVIKIPLFDVDTFTTLETQQWISECNHGFSAEITAGRKLTNIPGVARLHDRYPFECQIRGHTWMSFYLLYENIYGLDLDKWCKKKFGVKFFGIPQQKEWFRLARAIAKVLELVHKQRVVHGDIRPSNIRMRECADEPVLIDFGQSTLLDKIFLLTKPIHNWYPNVAPERIPEVDNNGATVRTPHWYAPADIYSLGGIFFYLATGDTPPAPWNNINVDQLKDNRGGVPVAKLAGAQLSTNNELKHQIASVFKGRNPRLYEDNPGIVDIILYCMRPSTDDRAPYVGAVLNVLNIFDPQMQRKAVLTLDGVKRRAKAIVSDIQKIKEIANPLFCLLCDSALKAVQDQIVESLDKQVHVLSGDREAKVNGLLRCFSALEAGDQCLALTTPWFWKDANCGSNGRLLTALRMAGMKKISIRWLLMATEATFKRRSIVNILGAQKDAMRQFEADTKFDANYDSLKSNIEAKGYYVGLHKVTQKEYDKTVDTKTIFLLLRKQGQYTLIAPDYTMSQSETHGSLSVLRFWTKPERQKELIKAITTHLPSSMPITCWGE